MLSPLLPPFVIINEESRCLQRNIETATVRHSTVTSATDVGLASAPDPFDAAIAVIVPGSASAVLSVGGATGFV